VVNTFQAVPFYLSVPYSECRYSYPTEPGGACLMIAQHLGSPRTEAGPITRQPASSLTLPLLSAISLGDTLSMTNIADI